MTDGIEDFIRAHNVLSTIFPFVICAITYAVLIIDKDKDSKFPFTLQGHQYPLMSIFAGIIIIIAGGHFSNAEMGAYLHRHYFLLCLYMILTGISIIYDASLNKAEFESFTFQVNVKSYCAGIGLIIGGAIIFCQNV